MPGDDAEVFRILDEAVPVPEPAYGLYRRLGGRIYDLVTNVVDAREAQHLAEAPPIPFTTTYAPCPQLDEHLTAELAQARAAWWAAFRDPEAHAVDLQDAARNWHRIRGAMVPAPQAQPVAMQQSGGSRPGRIRHLHARAHPRMHRLPPLTAPVLVQVAP
jgi:hypothetical protein